MTKKRRRSRTPPSLPLAGEENAQGTYTPPVPKEFKDQQLEGGWKVFLPGTGLSYAKFVPQEERERRERNQHV